MRRLLYILVGLFVLVLVVLAAGYAALRSERARAKIESTLSAALGQPVKLGGIEVDLLPIPTLDARDISIGGADSNAAPGLWVKSMHVVPRVSSFLPGRTMTIDKVELRGLTIALRKDKTGRWLLPAAPAPTAGRGGGGRAPAVDLRDLQVREGRIRVVDDSLARPKGGPTITTITDVEAQLRAVGGTLMVPRFTGTLGRTSVSGSAEAGPKGAALHLASESIHNADLPSLFALAAMQPYPGLSVSGKAPFELATTVAPDLKTFVATGKASVERVQLGTLALEAVSSSFRFENGVFTLDPLSFTFFGGKLRGTVGVDLTRPVPVYTINSSLAGLDVNRALNATTTMKNYLLGRGSVTTNVRGSGSTAAAIRKSLAGTVQLRLADGVITNFPLLAAVNRALGITEGTGNDTKFQSFAASAAIGGGKARTNDLLLRAGEFTVTGSGVLGFDQSLDFKLRAVMSAAKSRQLLAKLGPLGRLRNQEGALAVPVAVTGTALAPKYRVEVGAVAKKQAREELEKGLIKLFEKK